MNWFSRVRAGLKAASRASELAQDLQTHEERVKALSEHVFELAGRVRAQEHDSAQMVTEWATTLDKISRWASRQSARERRDTDKKLDTLAAGPGENGPVAPPAAMTRPQLRALAARQRSAPNVAVDEGK